MLGRCRTPLGFLLHEWRDGRSGTAVMGAHHGVLCVGCWALMGLLFVLGVMNLLWIALLTTVVLVEKIIRRDAQPRALGALMMVWGSSPPGRHHLIGDVWARRPGEAGSGLPDAA